ncbi:MAG: 3-oxoacyl-[acyl-carrier-protein] reductase [Desulfobacula sp.]|uniref:3-oxoacyl-[acyl-carrier-protein] reductase n=1 Tax=Desulfobacula sp. TaxID=2593537 RepID=UPI0025BC3F63|nr:3-oxoacyl-[acyl-carrier-protein] reductase [Desulfobacula sp.]MCD4719716.1 3-oxoacyl-[acyl-carrier-protein] reductase [Desulfobacula sp.]
MTQFPLKDKVALVTGAGRGIGEMIALALAVEGADIFVNDIDRISAETVAKKINSTGRKTLVHTADIADRNEVGNMFSQAIKIFGKIDILVNNAGITRDNLILNMTEEEWDMVMDINLKGVFNCTQQAAVIMKEQKSGKIVNLTSVSAQMGNVGQVNYTASKAGVIGMTKTLAKELARYNINVNAVAPGFILTPMTKNIPDTVKQIILQSIPLGRPGKPEDVAKVVKFLSTDDSAYVTGQVISCNGGMYL